MGLAEQDQGKLTGAVRAARASIAGKDDLAPPSVEPDAAVGWLEVLVDAVVADGPGCVADVLVLDEGTAGGQLIQDVRCPAGLYAEGDVTLLFLRGGGSPLLAPAGGSGGGDVTNNNSYWFASAYGSD